MPTIPKLPDIPDQERTPRIAQLLVVIHYQVETIQMLKDELPPAVTGHFSPELNSYILYQYYQCHVTQPLLLEQLHEFDIKISSRQVNQILVGGHDNFHQEKNDLLNTALEIRPYIQVDGTGARHGGSERDIREYAKRRKISGSTRSSGRQCRDTFTSLKKTCRKLGVSFWEFLQDRIGQKNCIPKLSQLMRCRAPTSTF